MRETPSSSAAHEPGSARPSPLADLSIVVVTWQSAPELPALLASLDDAVGGGAELVVVDNASRDGAPALVRAAMPAAIVIENAENRGFAAAANQGLRASRCPFVLFLNPDTIVPPGTLVRALAHAAREPSIGILGCCTLDARGVPQPTVDRFHTVGRLALDALLGRRWLGTRPRGRVPETTTDVDWLYGAFLLCRRAVLERLGGFDEAYEMYGEDLDLCLRVSRAGVRVVYLADVAIVHHGNRSGERRYGPERDVAVLKGTLRFFRRHHGAHAERAFRLLAGASFAAKAAAGVLRGLAPGGRAAAARARVYARMAWLCARGDPAAAGDPAPPLRLRAPGPAGIERP
jgi:GT2 family glycosyltransferase